MEYHKRSKAGRPYFSNMSNTFRDCLKVYHPECVGEDDSFVKTKVHWSCGKSLTTFMMILNLLVNYLLEFFYNQKKANIKGRILFDIPVKDSTRGLPQIISSTSLKGP
jgi:hypothetical protein